MHLSQSFQTKMRSMNLCVSGKREHYFRKKNHQILYKIPTYECDEPKLLGDLKSHKMHQFSPDIKLTRRRIFKQHEILNNSLLFDTRMRSANSFKTNESHLFSSSKYMDSIKTRDQNNPKNVEDRIMNVCREMRYVSTQNNSKTPMQKIQNPLPSFNFDEHNKSQKDDGSEYSEDDLLFLDEYFNIIPYTPHGNIEMTPGQLR